MIRAFLLTVSAAVLACASSIDTASTSSLLQELREAHPLWLRERCQESFYADEDTRQPRYNLHEEEEDLTVAQVSRDEAHQGFVARFSDDHECFFEDHMIVPELQNEHTFLQAPEWDFPPLFVWDKALMAPPLFEHDEIVNESDQTRKFLSILISTGLALVSDVPRDEGECARFGEHFSTLRETEWGKNFNVRSTPDTTTGVRKDLAYTPNKIGMHVDSPYRIDTPPAFQLLHAITHCSGPDCQVHNRFVDGFRVAQALCAHNREFFHVLTSTVLRWENNGGDDSSLLYRYAPMLELEDIYGSDATTTTRPDDSSVCPSIKAVNFSAKSGGYAPNLPKEQLELFYQAKRKFSALLHSDDYAIRLQLYPGALVVFDNRRVLHSRSGIAETDGERWLQGCYLNRDGVYYLYERMRRKWSILTETPFRNLHQATVEDFDRMGDEYNEAVAEKTLDNLVELLESQKESYLGAPVSLYEHNLQTASRVLRAGEDDDTVVASLFHDVFETLFVKNHGELASAMLAPWLSPKSHWMLAHHEIFQGYYYFDYYGADPLTRDIFIDHPYYNWTVTWCEDYDQASFDPDYPSLPLVQLLPVVERVLSRTPYWWNPAHPKAGAVSGQEVTQRKSNSERNTAEVVCQDTWTCH